ncbi:DUF2513 domain-containing protein [Fusobacterium varium]|uniref:DUF2513 domain-containing protein n=1 Tax=Fusobacterium TaxID=848 RepID=UPI0030CDF510
MRLNPDCIRDILLKLEEITDGSIVFDVGEYNYQEYTDKYSSQEFYYHVRQCFYHNFLIGTDRGNYINVRDISPAGHAFLENIRNDNNWNKTKEIATKVGSFSLNALKDIAVGVVSAGITASLK